LSHAPNPGAPAAGGAVALAGRSAVVTGASRGIGFAVAAALAAAGVRTWMVARDPARLHDAARSLGSNAFTVPCDVSDAEAVARAASVIGESLGGAPDILVNNAGLFPLASIEATSPEVFAETMNVNVVAPFRFVRAFLGDMRARGTGHIVTLGSVSDRLAFPENGAYAASKNAQRAFHEVLRLEVRGSGVRTTLVSPGPTDTDIWDPVDPDNREGFPPRSLMLRADDVADAVLWAVSRPGHVNIEELRLARS
jgi:NADP-dependent 3-hydroxy acid dehydrogenase YdfG